ncbi:MAG: ATP-binding protein [Prevotella sp.]|nr:ATP-binding protein [Prevotella sp.]
MEQKKKRYPVGIQTFSRIISDGYIYVDKTDLMWQLAHLSPYVFLSRPRRFGKSLLSSTLRSFFEGRKDLFEGLKAMELEREWKAYPVLHLDLSTAKHLDIAGIRSELGLQLKPYEDLYGSNPDETSPGMRLGGIIQRAYSQTGSQVVVIIDEYDAPLLDVLHEELLLGEVREVLQEFYQRLKKCEPMLRFCFITGITKFSQLSIFSTINNLANVSMDPAFAAICGITEEELTTALSDDIALLAQADDYTPGEMRQRLKDMYDGYRFSEQSPDIYNPFSLMKAFLHKRISNYWFDSGTPTFLIRQMERFRTDITAVDSIEAPATAFDRPTEAMTNALPLLYQAGYLTIKGYDRETQSYSLSLPNKEVRVGFIEGLLPAYVGLDGGEVQMGFALKFWRALKQGDIELALQEMQAYLASLPYVEGFKRKLEDAATREGFYEYTFYLVFSILNVYARTQVKTARGRTDMVVQMPDTVYVFELKVDGSAREALEQIGQRGYALAYSPQGRRVVKVGLSFSSQTRTISEWVIDSQE